jgi:hypothetical protein
MGAGQAQGVVDDAQCYAGAAGAPCAHGLRWHPFADEALQLPHIGGLQLRGRR